MVAMRDRDSVFCITLILPYLLYKGLIDGLSLGPDE
jgi:hypothetical protein